MSSENPSSSKQPTKGFRVAAVGMYGITNALPRLSNALLALAYTSVFSLAEYGAFGILSVTVLLLSTLIDLGISQAIMRNYFDNQTDWPSSQRYLANAIFSANMLAIYLLPLLGIVLYAGWVLSDIKSFNIPVYILLIVATAFCDRTATMLSQLLRATERPLNYATGAIVDAAVSVFCGVTFVLFFNWGVVGAMTAALIGSLASVSVYQYIFRWRLGVRGGRMDWHLIKKSLSFGLPLVPTRFSIWLRESGLRPILTQVTTVANIGIFSLASSVAALPGLLFLAVELALFPHYLKRRTDGAEGFTDRVENFTTALLACLAPIWAGLILFSDEFIVLLIGDRYAAAAPICSILLSASFLRMQQAFFVRQIQFMRRTWIQLAVMIPAAICSVSLALFFATSWGILYAAYGVLIAEIGCLIAYALIIRLYEPLHYPIITATGLSIFLIAFAVINALNLEEIVEPTSFNAIKFGIFFALTLFCIRVLIWPRRVFIKQVALQ